jgi:hypothetical protein
MPPDDRTPPPAKALPAKEAARRAEQFAADLDRYDPAEPSDEPWWPPEPSDWN